MFSFWNVYLLKVFHTVPDQYDNRRLSVKINILLLILHVISSRFPPGIFESAPGDGYSCPLQHLSCVPVVVWYCGEPISHHQAFVWHFLKKKMYNSMILKIVPQVHVHLLFKLRRCDIFKPKCFNWYWGFFFKPWSFEQWKL